MSRRNLVWVALLVMLAVAKTAVASFVLSDFVIFSGGSMTIDGGNETEIGGHTVINGDIGSNQDLDLQGNPLTGYPAQLNGSAYAGGNLTFGQDLTVGSSSGPLREVVANGEASIGGGADIYGNLYGYDVTLGQLTGILQVTGPAGGNVQYTGLYTPSTAVIEGTVSTPSTKTFGLITMPAATVFTAGGAPQQVETGQDNSLTLAPNTPTIPTYGALSTSSQNQSVILSSGNYYFDSITTQGGFDLQIDLTSGNPVNIYVVGDADFAGNQTLMVKGAGTGEAYVPIDEAPQLAALIYLETHGKFTMTGGDNNDHNIWGGTVYASQSEGVAVDLGQYMDWYGAAYAYDSFDTADHGYWDYVPLQVVPEPTTILAGALLLLPFGATTLRMWRKTRKA